MRINNKNKQQKKRRYFLLLIEILSQNSIKKRGLPWKELAVANL